MKLTSCSRGVEYMLGAAVLATVVLYFWVQMASQVGYSIV